MSLPHVQEIATYLATVSPTLGTIVRDATPETPDVVLVVYGNGGAGGEHGFGREGLESEMPGIQLLARGPANDSATPSDLIMRAFQAMAKIQGVSLSGTFYRMARPQHSPFKLDKDAKNRITYSVSFLVDKEPSA